LNTLFDAAEFVTIAVAEVVTARTAVFPVIVFNAAMFGAAMIYPPKINEYAIDFAFVTSGCGTAPISTQFPE